MIEKMIDTFMRFRFSKWWYVAIALIIFAIGKLIGNARQESKVKYDRIQSVVLNLLGIFLFFMIFLVVFLFISGGFLGDLANDLSMVMGVVLAMVLLLIPLVYAFLNRKKRK